MTIITDEAPEEANVVIDAALANRFRYLTELNIAQPVLVARPIAHKYFTISRSERESFRFRRVRSWDYFVFGGSAVAVATVRQIGATITFEGIISGAIAQRLSYAVRLFSTEFGKRPERFYIRFLECRAARLTSVVLQSKSGKSYYLNVVDNGLLNESALRLLPNVRNLEVRARKRLSWSRM